MYELRILGEATLRGPSGNLIHFRSRKHFALLTYLALNADRAHRRERLVGLLWSDGEDSKARHSLSQALYAIRLMVNGAVCIEGEDLEFKPRALYVDALDLERHLQSGKVASAADLYRGDFLEGFWVRRAKGFEEWMQRERARLSALARDALREAIKQGRERCDWAEVRLRAERLVELDPYDEAAYAELMRAFWMTGDRAAALARYESLQRVLAEELGTEPSHETRALAERIRQRPVRGAWRSRRLLRESEQPIFQDPPFVGRKRELAVLAHELEGVLHGESRAVAIVGGAGIGKTRLAEQFLGSLALDDLTILRGCCYAAEQSLPYGPVAEALRQGLRSIDLSDVKSFWLAELARIVPEVRDYYGELPEPAKLDVEGGRRRLYEGVAQVLRAACDARPILLFIDDLHWADDSSLALLHYVLRRVSNGLFLLTAHRPEELGTRGSRAMVELLSGESLQVRSLLLEGLDDVANSDLLQPLLGEVGDSDLLRWLMRRSGGNPFFAIELARSLAEGEDEADRGAIPDSIKSLLGQRFECLGERALNLMQQAAVIGSRTSFSVLSAAAGLSPFDMEAAFRELTRAGLLVAQEESVRFRHDLIREVCLDAVPAALRGVLHLKAARAQIGHTGDPGEIASHFAAAGDSRRAYGFALRGADAAERVYALEEAAALLELGINNAGSEAARAELIGRLGKLYLHLRQYARGRPLLEARLRHVERHGSLRERLEAERDLLFLEVYSAALTVEESCGALKKLHTELLDSGLDAAQMESQILGALVWATARSFNPVLLEETIARIRQLHERSREPAIRWRTARTLGIYECYRGDLERAELHLTDAMAAAEEAEDEVAILECFIGFTALLLRTMDVELAHEILATALPMAERQADPAKIASILCNCAVCFMYLRDGDHAERLLLRAKEIVEASGDLPDTVPSVLYDLGFVANTRAQTERSKELWQSSLRAAQAHGVKPIEQECYAALGLLELRDGDVTSARELAARSLRLARRGKFLVDERFGLEVLRAELQLRAGRNILALRRLQRIAARAIRTDIPLYLTIQITCLRLLVEHNRIDEAKAIRDAVRRVAEPRGARWWISQADRVLEAQTSAN